MKKVCSLLILSMLLFFVGCTKSDPELFTVTFETNGGTKIEAIVVRPTEKVFILHETTRDGYTFDGWYLDETFTVEFESESTIDKSITIYAKWIADQYTIKFFSNAGSRVDDIKVNHSEILQKPKDPTRANYVFKGWYLDRELTNSYDFNKPVTYQFDLYAKWEEEAIPLVNLDEYDAYYISTSPGADSSTMVNISYHTKNLKTSIEYTTKDDVDYLNKKVVNVNPFGFESLLNMEKPFERRNVCQTTLTKLTPNTAYQYRINKGNGTYSDNYYFKTSGGNDTTSFMFMTDVHYYDGFDGAEVSETVIEKALEIQPNLDFVFTTGDMLDTGGNSDDWDKMFTNSLSYKKLPYASVPGNHEHYEVGNMKNKIFTSYFNFPKNGIEDYLGASYYFIHNDTLFIQVDTDSTYNQGKQLQWLESTIKNNPTKFVIVGTHAPVNEAGSDYNRGFMEVLEKYSVDLMLAGHYHSDSFKTTYLDKTPTNLNIGVTYMRGAGGGVKALGDAKPEDFAKGYIIDVLDDKIVVKYINGNGKILATRTVINKKLHEKETATKQELLDSITPSLDLEKGIITFDWSSKFFKNVKEMILTEDYRDQRKVDFIFPTPGYVRYSFDKISQNYDSQYTFKITFEDGTVEYKTFVYELKGGIGLVASEVLADQVTITYDVPNEADKTIVKEYEVYINGTLMKTYNAKDNQNNLITSTTITGLTSNTEYTLKVKVIGRYGFLYAQEITFKTK